MLYLLFTWRSQESNRQAPDHKSIRIIWLKYATASKIKSNRSKLNHRKKDPANTRQEDACFLLLHMKWFTEYFLAGYETK
jgi:hypothetical protein